MDFSQHFKEFTASLKTYNSRILDHTSIDDHLIGAVDWIKKAYTKASGAGISKGYNIITGHWYAGYPETTGYTIPTLLNYSISIKNTELFSFAISLADYLLNIRTAEGGVGHWKNTNVYPVVFDTGQVIFGWLAAFDASSDKRYLNAAQKAGDWLISVQHSSGSWKDFQHLGVEKVIDTRVSWALLELYKRTGNVDYRKAAINNLEWSLKQQMSDGWLQHCSFTENEDPFTHTLAYTAEGLFESGIILEEEGYIDAARLTADALLAKLLPDGRLWGAFGQNWKISSNSICLTGNCQLACLWFRLYEYTKIENYLKAANKALNFVASTQYLDKSYPNIHGGVAGSYPVYGKYERLKYPNWAAKFFIDALLSFKFIESRMNNILYVG